jgi:WhiB family redox-sensing transcriptional regulator
MPAELEQAKAYCQQCPLRAACLAGALERGEPCGVWGGEIFHQGAIIARKRPRGRPPRTRPDVGRDHCGRLSG